jgi:hypothetical protein
MSDESDARLNDLVEDMRECRREIGEISRSIAVIESYGPALMELKGQMKVALVPVLFAKWLAIICGGGATICGAFYGLAKFLLSI